MYRLIQSILSRSLLCKQFDTSRAPVFDYQKTYAPSYSQQRSCQWLTETVQCIKITIGTKAPSISWCQGKLGFDVCPLLNVFCWSAILWLSNHLQSATPKMILTTTAKICRPNNSDFLSISPKTVSGLIKMIIPATIVAVPNSIII